MADGQLTINMNYSGIQQDFKNIEKMADSCAKYIQKSFEAMSTTLNGSVEKVQEKTQGVGDIIQGLSGGISDFKDSIGGATDKLSSFIENMTLTPVIENVSGVLEKVNEIPQKIKDSLESSTVSFDKLKQNYADLSTNLEGCKGKLTEFFNVCLDQGPLAGLGEGCLGLNTTFLGVAVLIAAVAAALIYLYTNSETFRDLVNESVGTLMEILNNLYTTVLLPLFTLLQDLFNVVLLPLITILTDVFVTIIEVIASLLLELWNNVLAPIVDFIVNILAVAIEGIAKIWESWQPIIEQIIKIIDNLWNNILKPIAIWVQETLTGVFQKFGEFIKWLAPFIMDIFQGIIDFFVGIFSFDMDKAWNGICKIFSGAFDLVCEIFAPIIEWFSDTFGGAWDSVVGAFSGVAEFFSGIWKNICSCFSNVTDWFKNIFSKAWQAVKDVFSAGGKIFDGIKDGILGGLKAVINALIDGINKVIKVPFDGINFALKTIKKVEILGFKPFDWISTIGVPQIPRLAKGGIVNRPTLTLTGEAGREAVLPLQNNTEWMDILAAKIQPANENMTIVLQVGGEELYRWFIKNKKKNDFVMNGG